MHLAWPARLPRSAADLAITRPLASPNFMGRLSQAAFGSRRERRSTTGPYVTVLFGEGGDLQLPRVTEQT
jgi:hypothetical protein